MWHGGPTQKKIRQNSWSLSDVKWHIAFLALGVKCMQVKQLFQQLSTGKRLSSAASTDMGSASQPPALTLNSWLLQGGKNHPMIQSSFYCEHLFCCNMCNSWSYQSGCNGGAPCEWLPDQDMSSHVCRNKDGRDTDKLTNDFYPIRNTMHDVARSQQKTNNEIYFSFCNEKTGWLDPKQFENHFLSLSTNLWMPSFSKRGCIVRFSAFLLGCPKKLQLRQEQCPMDPETTNVWNWASFQMSCGIRLLCQLLQTSRVVQQSSGAPKVGSHKNPCCLCQTKWGCPDLGLLLELFLLTCGPVSLLVWTLTLITGVLHQWSASCCCCWFALKMNKPPVQHHWALCEDMLLTTADFSRRSNLLTS